MNRKSELQRGFTLVELMIGMALGLLIMLGLITLWVNINRNSNELSKANRVIENGRLTLQLLQNDVAHAGFLAGFIPDFDDLTVTAAPTQVPNAVPDPCLSYSVANWTAQHQINLLGIPVQAYEVPTAGTAPVCAGVVTNPKPGTHVLVVRRLETCTAGSGTGECASTLGTANPNVYFQASRCSTDATTHALATSGLTLQTRACDGTLAPIHRFVSTLYYIRTFKETAGDGIPTLMRSTFAASGNDPVAGAPTHLAAQPLVEGVEGFVVRLGLDNRSDTDAAVDLTTGVTWASSTDFNSPTNRGDGNPDTYVTCTAATPCTAAQLVNAVAVKIDLLMRSEETSLGYTDTKKYYMGGSAAPLPTFNDSYKRHLFHQTIRLTNVSGRRETP
jgi:type IV pilus assembly protein PilW